MAALWNLNRCRPTSPTPTPDITSGLRLFLRLWIWLWIRLWLGLRLWLSGMQFVGAPYELSGMCVCHLAEIEIQPSDIFMHLSRTMHHLWLSGEVRCSPSVGLGISRFFVQLDWHFHKFLSLHSHGDFGGGAVLQEWSKVAIRFVLSGVPAQRSKVICYIFRTAAINSNRMCASVSRRTYVHRQLTSVQSQSHYHSQFQNWNCPTWLKQTRILVTTWGMGLELSLTVAGELNRGNK